MEHIVISFISVNSSLIDKRANKCALLSVLNKERTKIHTAPFYLARFATTNQLLLSLLSSRAKQNCLFVQLCASRNLHKQSKNTCQCYYIFCYTFKSKHTRHIWPNIFISGHLSNFLIITNLNYQSSVKITI